ncbi:hypothetical protein Vadar_021211 [Vaccinium darrowii]|uniref:Uncharacterized protein n=1 Tax=Vaccinium darrowii TaxID=229202 RepID=A0ACB7YNW2_9ERIC|nr:hypothetical protein Vadar_021211 [Vaccinium darrowii]
MARACRNIDLAPVSVVDILTEFSMCGRLTNGQGRTIDFTKTLVIILQQSELNLVQNLKQELFEQLDDAVVFSSVATQYSKAIARLKLREIASYMTPKACDSFPQFPYNFPHASPPNPIHLPISYTAKALQFPFPQDSWCPKLYLLWGWGKTHPGVRVLSSVARDFEIETHLILESVAAELHALLWMTVSPAYLERQTALPFHCDMVLRLRRLLHFADKELSQSRRMEKTQV